jgi:capsular polysaccharide export protein
MHDMLAPRIIPRNVLLLQGLVGPFFSEVGAALRAEGYGVFKVNFNGGDALFWKFNPGGIGYTGTLADWPAALEAIIARHGITDVLLFGDCRPVHRAAIAVCRDLRIAVHVFDEGYIRPDWVTFELGGVNGHSQLPRDPAHYLANARLLPPAPPHYPVPSSFRRRALEAVFYDLANIALRWRFPHWHNHRPWSAWKEGFGWLRRLAGRKAARARTEACLAGLADTPYFLFPLQLDSDAQIRFHSSFTGMAEAIRLVIASFAAHAPAEVTLLLKEHPLDNGLRDWRALAAELAAEHGVAQRVVYIETGDIALIVLAARGLVTVNSTTGTLALACGVPVQTLGHAVYDVPGITCQAGLDRFWAAPGAPDAEVFEAFRRVLVARCLIPGGFFSDTGMDLVVRGVVARMRAHCPVAYSAGLLEERLAWA